VIYLYAIAQGLSGVPDVDGLDGAPLDRRRCEDFDLVVSEHGAAVEPSEEAVLAHARVVEALMPHADALLPARFGLAFADTGELEQALREKAGSLEESLERVRGRVELGIRVVGEQSAPPSAENGREYLEARRRQLAAADEFHESLAEQARASARGNSSGRLVLSGAYLVDPGSIPAFREAVGELESEHPSLSFALTGPWPPYSFAGVES
jgi:hypothetical protein